MQTITEAMKRGEMTEEEAYFVLRFAGHHGYREAMKRLGGHMRYWRRQLLWIGGWESPELCQWDRGWPAWRLSQDPTPVSILGHIFTHYGWGWSLRVFGGHLTKSRHKIYWSPDGTPNHAEAITLWRFTNNNEK